MVGFDHDTSHVKHRKSDYVIAGAVSGFTTRTVFQPLDVVKIRFQLQIEPIHRKSKASKYKGMIHAVRSIIHDEGILALWKGIVPAQFLSISYGAIQFLAFEVLTQQVKKNLPNEALTEASKPIVNFSCGAIAGLFATVGSFPFDVARTRFVAQGEPKFYRNILHAASSMLRVEGPLSFYKGLSPTLIQIMPNAGFQFAFYRLFQGLWVLVFNPKSESSVFQNGFCGAAAGMGAKIAIYPLDLVKKRIQVQGFEEARKSFGAVRKYTNFRDCIKVIFKEERITGFYKGLMPSVWKAALTTGSHFLFYEETLKILAHFHQFSVSD